jgi:hypothetical protein
MYQPVAMNTLEAYPTAAQALVVAAVKLLRSDSLSKSKVSTLGALQSSFVSLCRKFGIPCLSSEFIDLVERLKADGFVNVGPHKDTARRPVSLVAAVADIEAVLSSKAFW